MLSGRTRPKESFLLTAAFKEKYTVATKVLTNDIIKISDVVDFSHGTNGHCWRVYFTTSKLPNAKVALPSCWSMHSSLWVKPESPLQQNKTGEGLTIDTKYLKRLKTCI